jgi:hypothetical protein
MKALSPLLRTGTGLLPIMWGLVTLGSRRA